MDREGRTIAFTKPQLMMRFRQLKAQGAGYQSSDEFLVTDTYDDRASLLMRRIKQGKHVLYNSVWRLHEGRPTQIIREFAIEEDLSDLIMLVEGAEGRPNCFRLTEEFRRQVRA